MGQLTEENPCDPSKYPKMRSQLPKNMVLLVKYEFRNSIKFVRRLKLGGRCDHSSSLLLPWNIAV